MVCCVSVFICFKFFLIFWFRFDFFCPIGCLEMCSLISTYLRIIQFFSLLISSFMPLWWEKIFGMISVFSNLLTLVLYHLSCRIFRVHLRTCVLLLLVILLYISVRSFDLNYSPIPLFPYWFFVLIFPLLKVGYYSPLPLLYCCLFILSSLVFAWYI